MKNTWKTILRNDPYNLSFCPRKLREKTKKKNKQTKKTKHVRLSVK